MRQTVSHWIPAVYCAFLSLIALSGSVGSDTGWWRPAFFAFLPMCFYFGGAVTSQMQRELRELRMQLAELREKPAG